VSNSAGKVLGVILIVGVLAYFGYRNFNFISDKVVVNRYSQSVDSFLSKYAALQAQIYRDAAKKIKDGEIKTDVDFDRFLQPLLSKAPEASSGDISDLFEKDFPRGSEGVTPEELAKGLEGAAARFEQWSKGI
jgi:hypothetical protein